MKVSPFPHFSGVKELLSVFIIVLLLVYSNARRQSWAVESSSIWIKDGSYAEYVFDSSSIWFMNGTFFSFPDEAKAKVTFRWQCISIAGVITRLNVSLSFTHETQDIWLSNLLDFNFETRKVTLLNGTYVGMTFLWLPSNLRENQTVTITDGIKGKVKPLGSIRSPQGFQNAFLVEGSGEFNGFAIAPGGGYDVDTGVLLESSFWGEPTLRALGILDPGRVGRVELVATNIDLGLENPKPEALRNQSSALILIAVLIGAFGVTFFTLIKRRGRRRR